MSGFPYMVALARRPHGSSPEHFPTFFFSPVLFIYFLCKVKVLIRFMQASSDPLHLVKLLLLLGVLLPWQNHRPFSYQLRLCRFDDLLILAACWAECSGSLLATLLPHDATARQPNGWPSLTTMKESL